MKFDTSTPLGHSADPDSVLLLPIDTLVTPVTRDPHPILKTTPVRSNGARRVLFSPTTEVMQFAEDSCTEDLAQEQTQYLHTSTGTVLVWRRALSDPTIPYMLLLYLQLLLNLLLVAVLVYVGWSFVSNVRRDISHKVAMYTLDAVHEILRCLREYYRNKCEAAVRAPALEQACTQWEKCMNRDPQQLGRAQISAETLADVVNGFVGPLSWKLVGVFVMAMGGGFGAVNFGMARCRAAAAAVEPPQEQMARPAHAISPASRWRRLYRERPFASGRALMHEDSPLQDKARAPR